MGKKKLPRTGKGYVVYRCRNCRMLYRAKDRDYKHTCSMKCSIARLMEAIRAMRTKTGPMYRKWLARTQQARQHRDKA